MKRGKYRKRNTKNHNGDLGIKTEKLMLIEQLLSARDHSKQLR